MWNLVFPRIRKGSSLYGFDWKENTEKGLRQWEKSIPELKEEFVCMCLIERKNNSFEIHVIILR